MLRGVSLFLSFFFSSVVFGQGVVYRLDTIISSTDSCIHHTIIIPDTGNSKGQVVNRYTARDCYYLPGGKKEVFISQFDKGGNTGVYYAFYENGKVKEFYHIVRGRKTGHYAKFDKKGKPLIVGNYKAIEGIRADTIISFDHGAIIHTIIPRVDSIKDGVWYLYDYQKKIITKEYWEDGVLIRTEVVKLPPD